MKERSWEYVGRTVEEATQTALEELGLEPEDVHVEVLDEPQKGFLGLGGKEARIRVELIGEWEVLGRKEEERGERAEAREEAGRETQVERCEQTAHAAAPVEMIESVLELFGIDAMVESKEREESVIIDVWGDDVAILIGKGGTNLEALQYLVNISCRRTGEVSKRIIVDVEGYRKRRKARLEKEAEQMAEKAVAQNKSVEMPPMNPAERKIVHVALRDFQGVRTESKGDGPDRRVVIHPE